MKNKLQELLAKRGRALPIYDTYAIIALVKEKHSAHFSYGDGSRPIHKGESRTDYKSTVHVEDENGQVRQFSGQRCTSKKKAEKSAASVAFSALSPAVAIVDETATDNDNAASSTSLTTTTTTTLTTPPTATTATMTRWRPRTIADCDNANTVVLVDCDNIAFVSAALVQRFSSICFRLYASYGANLPHVERCQSLVNCTLHYAPKPGQDLVDTMIMLDTSLLAVEPRRLVVIVSKDKALYNLEVLLSGGASKVQFVSTLHDLDDLLMSS